jgi:hypothetical protein
MKISRLFWPDFSEHLDFLQEEEEAPFAGFFVVVHNP